MAKTIKCKNCKKPLEIVYESEHQKTYQCNNCPTILCVYVIESDVSVWFKEDDKS
jgi:hypothetical protein